MSFKKDDTKKVTADLNKSKGSEQVDRNLIGVGLYSEKNIEYWKGSRKHI